MDDDDCPMLVDAKVPVTILTGFLGSGKTTLLQRVLTEQHNLRIAVVVNEFEFGKSIEKGLTLKSTSKPDDEWVELDNGCMCCSAQSQAVVALEKLMQRKGMFDLVLIETSGLADPGPVAAMFWQDEALCGSLYLCGIVAVVDARNALANMRTDSSNEMVRQLLCADTILINKVDLLERPGGVCADNCHPLPAESSCTPSTSSEAVALCDVVSTMAQLNPAARLLTSSYAQIDDLQSLLFVHTVNRCGIEAASGTYRPANGSSGFGQVVPHLHSTITSLSLSVVACASEHRQAVFPSLRSVDLLCRDLLYHEGKESFSIVRMKAAVWVAAGSERSQEQEAALHQLQAICDLFDVKPMAGETVPRGCCRFLVLGRQLDAARIEQIILEHIS